MTFTHQQALELKRWNTPTLANGWERISQRPNNDPVFNIEPTTDYMPQMGPMVGRAVTFTIQPSQPAHCQTNPHAWSQYRQYLASVPGPKIVVVQDLDKPSQRFSCWGEVNANIHRALGCVGVIVDGCIRDLDEMTNAGFKALATRLSVSHGYATPVSWGQPVEVFGTKVQPGQWIHADKHGFFAIPPEDEARLLEASRFMDANECATLIPAARDVLGKSTQQILDQIDAAAATFDQNAAEHCRGDSEF